MSKKILIVNQNSGYLTIDVANAFLENYEEVVLMYGRIRITDRELSPKIKIQKTIAYNRTSALKRVWTWGICTVHLFILLLFKYRGYSILYYSNPPMSYFNSLFFKNPFSVVVFDIYPDALRLIGINESSFIYNIWKWVNKKVFAKATQIITLSEGMKKQLTNYVDESKIKVVSIWPGSENFIPIPKNENPFLKQYGWVDKFIILYSGNMGVGHKLEVLIDVAEELKTYKEIFFLFIGEGSKKKKLIDLVEEKKLDNVSFLTWQDSSVLRYSLAAGDIAIVALEPEVTYASVPSKTFNYMGVGSVILGIGNKGSELQYLIENQSLGFYVDGNSGLIIKDFILNIKGDLDKAKFFRMSSFDSSKKFSYKLSSKYY